MKKEINFMKHNGALDLVEFPKAVRKLVASGSLRLNVILMETLNVTRLDLLLRDFT